MLNAESSLAPCGGFEPALYGLKGRHPQANRRTGLVFDQIPSSINKVCAHRERRVGREALESSSAVLQTAARPSQLPAREQLTVGGVSDADSFTTSRCGDTTSLRGQRPLPHRFLQPTKKARRRVDAGPRGSSERVGHASSASLIAQRGVHRPFAFGGALGGPGKRQAGGFRRKRDGYEIKPEHGWHSSHLNIPDRSLDVSLIL